MPRLTREDARAIASAHSIDLAVDFHTLSSSAVERIIEAADAANYRKPANANGSRARCFHGYLRRAAGL